jgi:hypothetical protein
LTTGLASLRAERRSRLTVVASQTVAEQLLPRWLVSLQTASRKWGNCSTAVAGNGFDTFLAATGGNVLVEILPMLF